MLRERVVLGAALIAACLLTPAAALGAAPVITITTPADGATYTVGEPVTADYFCTDPDTSGPAAECTGPVPDGAPVDTSAPGPVRFTVNANDGAGGSSDAFVNYTVRPAACDPTNAVVGFEGAVAIRVTCPSAGGTIEVADPPNGTATVTATREITYEPDASFSGTDTFTYRVVEGGEASAPATVTVDVKPAACSAPADRTTARTTAIVVQPECVGTFVGVAFTDPNPSEGTVEPDPESDGLRFTPPGDFVGATSFEYCAADAGGACVSPPRTVDIEVGPCADVSGATMSVLPASVQLDCLPDDATLTIVDQPANGTVTIGPGNVARYQLTNAAFSGTEVFTYKLDDADPEPIVATGTITVAPFSGGGNPGGGDGGGGSGDGGGGGGGLVPDEPDTPGPGLPPLPFLPSLNPGGPGSGNIPTRFERQTGVALTAKGARADRKGRFTLSLRNANPFTVFGTATVTGAFRKNRAGKRVPGLRVHDPGLRLTPNGTTKVRLRLNRAGRRLLDRKGKLGLRLELRVRDVEGDRRTVQQRFTLRAPKPVRGG